VVDELVTDFIIETCHTAARAATYSNRQKIKVDDFKFAIRNNESMLGRVQHLLTAEVNLRKERNQHFGDVEQGRVGLERAGRMAADGAGEEAAGDSRPRKKRKKKNDEEEKTEN
jgi:transcription initiation factor TFIID subunit 13